MSGHSKRTLSSIDRNSFTFVDSHNRIVSIQTYKIKILTTSSDKFLDMHVPDLGLIALTARTRAGLTQEQAADQIGCSRPLVVAWEKGDNKIAGGKYLLSAARTYKVRPEYLANGVGTDGYPWPEVHSSSADEDVDHTVPHRYVKFPLLEGYAGLDPGDQLGDYPEVVDSLRISRQWVTENLRGVAPEHIRVITGRGDSMRGQYNDGDLIFIDASIKQFDQDGAYCFRWAGRVQVKRLQLIGKGKICIISKNKEYLPVEAPLEEIEVGGRAIAVWTLTEF